MCYKKVGGGWLRNDIPFRTSDELSKHPPTWCGIPLPAAVNLHVYGRRPIVRNLVNEHPRDYFRHPHHFTLRDKFRCIKLGDNAFQDFIANWRKYALIVVKAKALVDFREMIDIWSREDTEGKRDHLQVFGASCGRDILQQILGEWELREIELAHSGLCAAVKKNSALKPWDQEMCSFASCLRDRF